jgi:hypothetical protein
MSSRCGFCGRPGHNRRNCPIMIAKAKEDPNGYAAYELAKIERAKKSPRLCSWCKQPGHTRRTCPDLRMALERESSKSRVWNKGLLDVLKSRGLGVGSMVRLSLFDPAETQGWYHKHIEGMGFAGIISEVNEKSIVEFSSMHDVLKVHGASGRSRWFSMPYDIHSQFYRLAYKPKVNIEVVGRVSEHAVVTSFSQKWHDGTIGARERLQLDNR